MEYETREEGEPDRLVLGQYEDGRLVYLKKVKGVRGLYISEEKVDLGKWPSYLEHEDVEPRRLTFWERFLRRLIAELPEESQG